MKREHPARNVQKRQVPCFLRRGRDAAKMKEIRQDNFRTYLAITVRRNKSTVRQLSSELSTVNGKAISLQTVLRRQ
ncbi:hypothetical protein CDAR_517711 [Caerostris darwini]|uniref:Uncharacterized protein n=1 Tax=Caerostris darwini TaxID=1538125 RepID=A0AAV4SE71_9ARAC|nr:hypothetical protein CDAR_517711 [Caerostris darwini]